MSDILSSAGDCAPSTEEIFCSAPLCVSAQLFAQSAADSKKATITAAKARFISLIMLFSLQNIFDF
ncbi:hypothetical protein [Ruminococcus albus]|uniref:hypothetical protein n=1 Tax=Ruminococcus albus TaxID=1264 RepID=UPI00116089AD|nr:hypothetical protein [Ruminococcus albus]